MLSEFVVLYNDITLEEIMNEVYIEKNMKLDKLIFLFWIDNEEDKITGNPYDITYEEYENNYDETNFQMIDFKNYYKKAHKYFSDLINLFNVDSIKDKLFFRTQNYNLPIFSLSKLQAEFIYEFFERKKKESVWSKILKIDNRNGDGFYKLFQITKNKNKFFEEIEFVINGLLNIYKDNFPDDKNGYENLESNLYITTQYNQIKCIDYLERLIPKLPLLTSNEFQELSKPYSVWEQYVKLFSVFQNNLKCEVDRLNKTFDIIKKNPKDEIIDNELTDKVFVNSNNHYPLQHKEENLEVVNVIKQNKTFIEEKISDIIDTIKEIIPNDEIVADDINTTTQYKQELKKAKKAFYKLYSEMCGDEEERFYLDLYVALNL